ncbi:hypothetical protein ACFYO7_29390 [Nocardia salmonicida]|uniref:hypothetical protein n=1 Tax=Nocardia salmonicida TaxID=53431 RepID=UPI0036A258CD
MAQSADARKRRHREEAHVIHAGDVRFDFDDVPLRIPGERFATPVIDVKDLVLPESESGLFHVLAESLSYSADDQRLREALQGAGREKAIHAGARDDLGSVGLVDHSAIGALTRFVDRILGYHGCDRRMAAGHRQFENREMDPIMLGLMCRLGCRDVEYRSAVSDPCAYVYGGGSHVRWARAAMVGRGTLLAALVLASTYMLSKALRRER